MSATGRRKLPVRRSLPESDGLCACICKTAHLERASGILELPPGNYGRF
jgi:hypothetical protein